MSSVVTNESGPQDEYPIPSFQYTNKFSKDSWFYVGGEWGQTTWVRDTEFSVLASFFDKVNYYLVLACFTYLFFF